MFDIDSRIRTRRHCRRLVKKWIQVTPDGIDPRHADYTWEGTHAELNLRFTSVICYCKRNTPLWLARKLEGKVYAIPVDGANEYPYYEEAQKYGQEQASNDVMLSVWENEHGKYQPSLF